MVVTSKDSMDVMLEAMMIDLVRRLTGDEGVKALGGGLQRSPRRVTRDDSHGADERWSEGQCPDGLALAAGES